MTLKTNWVNGDTVTAAYLNGLGTEVNGKQPQDSDLTAIAALTTTTYGRSLLTAADADAAGIGGPELVAPPPTGNRTTDTAAVQALVDTAQATRGTVVLRAGTYAIDIVTDKVIPQPKIVGQGMQFTLVDGTIKYSGVSGEYSGGYLSDFTFTGSHAEAAALELNGVCNVHWARIRVQGTYATGILFHNELEGDYTEVNSGSMNFKATCANAVEYRTADGMAPSFHGSGLELGSNIQTNGINPAILLSAGARPYNAPLSTRVWVKNDVVPVIQNNGLTTVNWLGNLCVEGYGTAAGGTNGTGILLCAGNACYLAGTLSTYLGSGVLTYGPLTLVNNPQVTGGLLAAGVTYGPSKLHLSSPEVVTGILDANGKNAIGISATTNAVNYFNFRNKGAGGTPTIEAAGTDSNIGLVLYPKAAGAVQIGVPTGQVAKIQANAVDTDADIDIIPQGAGIVKANGLAVARVDANGNLTADNFIATATSQAAANGTLTLTIDSARTQVFTGSTAGQIVQLPTTGITAGMQYIVVNQSTQAVTVQSSGANTILVQTTLKTAVYTANVDTPTGVLDWSYLVLTGANTFGAGTTAIRDVNGNLSADVFMMSSTSTVTAAGTLTMSINDRQVQIFTGSTTHTVKLPTTSVLAGQQYTIINQSSGAVAVQSSGANSVASLAGGAMGVFSCMKDTPTAAADWKTLFNA